MVNWISVRSLLAIAITHKLPSRSIDFVLDFTESELDVDVFMKLPLGMGVYGNRVEWVRKFKKPIYGIKQ